MTKYFENRELSWLGFNERVLQEAADNRNPLLERLKFLGIFSNNRDEFFKVRVGTYRRIIKFEQKKSIESGFKPEDVLVDIEKLVFEQEKRFNSIYVEIKRELSKNNVNIIDETFLTKEQGIYVKDMFRKKVVTNIFPIILDSKNNLSDILKDGTLYLVVEPKTEEENNEKSTVVVLEVPVNSTGRFFVLPQTDNSLNIMLLDDVIRFCLDDLFSVLGYDGYNGYIIKFTRDAELDIDPDASKSFLELMSESVKKRKKASAVRFVYEERMPQKLLKRVMKRLKISDRDSLRAGGRYHNFKDFIKFPSLRKPEMLFSEQPPLDHVDFRGISNFFDLLRQKDVMLHYPYHSFDYLINFIRESSIDPFVTQISMTFYRAASQSNVMNALINAARNGKKVAVFLELQARFNEEENIYWINRLQEEGVDVYEPIPGYKVHSKLLLVKRVEESGEQYYSHISTGNFNETTAGVYADDSLFTANPLIGKEVEKVFLMFSSRFETPKFKHLIVSPFATRKSLLAKIEREIINAKRGKKAWIIFKMNSLVDRRMAKKIIQAAEAGVSVKLIIRGICVLKPSKEFIGNKNIEIISIVGRYLEHSRLYIFGNGGNVEYYFGSADLMPRNLDTRVEVLCPVYDLNIQKELWDMIQFQLADNVKARHLDEERYNQYKRNDEDDIVDSQQCVYNYFAAKLNK